jgi:plastocyanin
MKPIRTPWLAALLLIGLAAACDGGTTPDPDPDAVTIRLTSGLRFSPPEIEIEPGTVVRWVNDAAIFHTVTPDNPAQPGVWQRHTTSGSGEVFRHTFTQSGQTYTYHCEPHVLIGMTGTIRVR